MGETAGTFWSGETLTERLPQLIEPFAPDRVDCAAYTLAIGPEVYVSPSDQTVDPGWSPCAGSTRMRLLRFRLVNLPSCSRKRLSPSPVMRSDLSLIRAKIKFRGLVNVSGFHVDPGYRGQLTFAVFNAGPVPIHLKRSKYPQSSN